MDDQPTLTTPLIRAEQVSKRFGHIEALRDLEFTLRAGEIHALLGGNGAGKSTFIKILAGIHHPDSGSINVEGEPLDARTRAKIAFIHQDAGLVPTLTVAENFGLVAGFPSKLGLVNESALRETVRAALTSLGLDISPNALVSELSPAEKSMVAISRAIELSARVLVLDEPTANLPAAEVETIWEVLRELASRGVGIVYVTHRLKEVFELCDQVTVLRDGATRAEAQVSSLSKRQLIEWISGRDAAFTKTEFRPGGSEPLLRVEGLDIGTDSPVSFAVMPGEVLAITGLQGAGQDEIAARLFGLSEGAGHIELDGQVSKVRSPNEALKLGIGYISGDRSETIARSLSVSENVLLNPEFTPVNSWFTRVREERSVVMRSIEQFDIRPPVPSAHAGSLSGGNAQKLVMARTQLALPKLLVLHDPTAGVDVGARSDFYNYIHEICDSGTAVLLVCSDYDEVQTLAHRVMVIFDGRMQPDLVGDDITEATVAQVAMGVNHSDN
ncbi:sugar ABC transporter ATP-binding protein [Agromyces laixinhei]|uniref:sugar ABC transporter ATP-binding protein n=1 Tax=Agromyces laixinhei TaxID=2585717 RepID=UPI0018DC604C|nr:sugar ABC transporter ATP-binding protein [Agromyces laixinhei]